MNTGLILTKCYYLEETQRAVQLKVEEDISSIYQMPEINPDILAAYLPGRRYSLA